MKTGRMKMRLLISLVFLLSFFFAAYSQPGKNPGIDKERREKIEAQKIAFITQQVNFTPEEAQRFWPVYNAGMDKMEAERKTFRADIEIRAEEIDNLSDEEAKKRLTAQLDHEQRMLNLKRELDKDLLGIISPQKIMKLHKAEHDFRMELVKKVAGSPPPHRDR